jgi:hypothetical protein
LRLKEEVFYNLLSKNVRPYPPLTDAVFSASILRRAKVGVAHYVSWICIARGVKDILPDHDATTKEVTSG